MVSCLARHLVLKPSPSGHLGLSHSNTTHQSLGFLALLRTQASSSLSSPRTTQSLLRQLTLKLPQALYIKILLEQYRKIGRRYYASAARTTLNPGCSCVSSHSLLILYRFHHQRLFKLPRSKSLKGCFRRYPCRNTTTFAC
jgi:hypothetical protein